MKQKRIWFKPTNIWQLNHKGAIAFAWRDFMNGHSVGMGLPANEVELVANWRVKYKTLLQVVAFKIRRLLHCKSKPKVFIPDFEYTPPPPPPPGVRQFANINTSQD